MGRRLALVAAALLALLLVVWWLRRGGSSQPADRAAATTTAGATAPAAPTTSRGGASAGGDAAADPLDEALRPGAPDPGELTRPPDAPPIELPPDTQLLAEEFVPGTTEWEEVPVLEGDERALRVLPVRYNVVAPDPIVVQLELVDGRRQRLPLPGAGVRVRPAASPDGWLDLAIADDGAGADAVAGDHLYTATLAPTAAQGEALLGQVIVEGRGDFPDAGLRRVPSALIYTLGPDAVLTGAWRDRLDGGHLILEAEVAVARAGTFTINAQLVGPQREPLVWTRATAALPAGKGWLTLPIWGKALREAGVDGPYQVRNVLLVRELLDTGDYAPGRTVIEAHRTAPYRAEQFSSAALTDPGPAGPQVGPDDPSQVGKPPPIGSRTQVP
ncbi:MAG: hypothetical protein JNK64_41290 [Myxococcales bacterium]|nr:hypothetical protein [Myxococcales bacterium]